MQQIQLVSRSSGRLATGRPAGDRPTKQPFEPGDEFGRANGAARALRPTQRVETGVVFGGHEGREIIDPLQYRNRWPVHRPRALMKLA